MNLNNSEVMRISKSNEEEELKIRINRDRINQNVNVRYLESNVNTNCTIKEEILSWVISCSKFYFSINDIIRGWNIPNKANIMLYASYYLPLLTYRVVRWTVTKKDISRLTEVRFL